MRPACPAARPDIKDETGLRGRFSSSLAGSDRRGRVGAVVSSMGHAPHSSEPRPAPNSEDNAVAPPDSVLRRDRCADGSCDDRGWLRRRAIVVAVAVPAGPPIDTHAPIAAGDPVGAHAPDHRSDVAVHGVAGTLDHGDTGPHRHTDPRCDRIAATGTPATATPAPTATPTPPPTATPAPTATPSPSPTPTAVATQSPTATPATSSSPTPSLATPAPSASPGPGSSETTGAVSPWLILLVVVLGIALAAVLYVLYRGRDRTGGPPPGGSGNWN